MDGGLRQYPLLPIPLSPPLYFAHLRQKKAEKFVFSTR
jgi:hypothetical protein